MKQLVLSLYILVFLSFGVRANFTQPIYSCSQQLEQTPIVVHDFVGRTDLRHLLVYSPNNIHAVTQDNYVVQVQPHDIVGIPNNLGPTELKIFLSNTWLKVGRFDNGDYKVTSNVKGLGGGKFIQTVLKIVDNTLVGFSPTRIEHFLNTISRRYTEAMRNANSNSGEVLWGGDIELIELSRIYNLRIIVHESRYNQNEEVTDVANPAIGEGDTEIHLWLSGNHYETYDINNGTHSNDVSPDGNCLFRAVLRSVNTATGHDRISISENDDIIYSRNQVANRLNNLLNAIQQQQQVLHPGANVYVTLNENDDPIRSRFAAIFEAENYHQMQYSVSLLPPSTLLNRAVELRNQSAFGRQDLLLKSSLGAQKEKTGDTISDSLQKRIT